MVFCLARHNTPADRSGPLVPYAGSGGGMDISELADCHLAKLDLGARFDAMLLNWSSKEEEEEEVSKSLRNFEASTAGAGAGAGLQCDRSGGGGGDCRWEDDDRAKSCIRYQREEAKIQAWIDLESAKAEAQSRKLDYLQTDDAAGVFAAPICSLLSSSLTELTLHGKEIERFTEQQEEALQLLTALQQLQLGFCRKLQCLPASGLRGLPNLKRLWIFQCSAIVSLPKGGLPNSLQELEIYHCSAIRTLPKGGLPNSLRLLNVRYCDNEELKGHCRKLIGTIPIVRV